MQPPSTFGDLLHAEQQSRGLNREGMASLLGLPNGTYLPLVYNHRRPSLELFHRIATALGWEGEQLANAMKLALEEPKSPRASAGAA